MNKLKLLILSVVLLFAGCASNPMTVLPQTAIDPPKEDESQIVFIRDSFVGGIISASLFDVSGEQPVFIGIIENGIKIPYKVTPGEHTFMVVSEAADFMTANMAAGKTYYSMVTPRMGLWKARFSLWPVKNDKTSEFQLASEDFVESKEKTKIATLSDKARAWYQKNKADIISKQKEYWTVWQQKAEADKAERNLTPADGM